MTSEGSRWLAFTGSSADPGEAVQDTVNRICAVLSKIFLIFFYFYE